MDPTAAVYYASGAHLFDHYPDTGTCDQTAQHGAFYSQFTVTRSMAANLYDKLNSADGWTAQLLAVPYDHEAAAASAERLGRPDIAYVLRTGRLA